MNPDLQSICGIEEECKNRIAKLYAYTHKIYRSVESWLSLDAQFYTMKYRFVGYTILHHEI